MEASITLKKVGKLAGGRSLLAGLSFGVERGTIVALLGPNGAGKTSLIKSIAGLVRPEFGQIFLLGIDATAEPARVRKLIGYAPQEPDFDPLLTLEENLLFSAGLNGLDEEEGTRRIHHWSKQLGIENTLHAFPRTVPHGAAKRALLARALLHDPPILLLDEPTASADLRARRQVWTILQELRGKRTILFSTHLLTEAEKLHDRILILDHGQVVLDGKLDRLLQDAGKLHHFRICFREMSDEACLAIASLPGVHNVQRDGLTVDFHGEGPNLLVEVLRSVPFPVEEYQLEPVGLETLLTTSADRVAE